MATMYEMLLTGCAQIGAESAPCQWQVVKRARGSVLHEPLKAGAPHNNPQVLSTLAGQQSEYLHTAALHAALDWRISSDHCKASSRSLDQPLR